MRHLIILALASVALGQTDPPCRSSHFQYCQILLAQNVGLNDTMQSLMFKDYTVMYNWFLYKWGLTPGSTTNMLNVCNSLEIFNGCMANDKGCFMVKNLMAQSDLNTAFAIDGTLTMYMFNCGPGINTLLHEGLACAQNIINGYQNYLQACVTTYMSSITYDYNNGCKYVKNLINCWSSPFSGGGDIPSAECRRAGSADVWWACEANRMFTINQFPNCGYTCNIQQQSAVMATHLETHHKKVTRMVVVYLCLRSDIGAFKVEDGVHFFKIPNYVSKIGGFVTTVEGPWMSN
ncbi:hypothetical protein OESDEN_02086 [Oesophagostomum dentatum]|uniref:SCP-like protein n=1 Tax=Oesophagostomum dentatum TaxID=61180 RepID=A0A0B1TRA3_OESDE|nr:hypothetical protein OESDEN_02086 [Oesophagostomum dentatum]